MATATVQLRKGIVDLTRRVLVTDDATVRLTTRECELLEYLAERPGEVVDRAELLTDVWGYAPTVVSRAVDSTAIRLRGKIEIDPAQPDHLMTHHGVGYQLNIDTGAPLVAVPPSPDLPRPADRFVGRVAELDQIEQAVVRARLVTLVGPAGAGKTRSSLEVARRRAEDGQTVVVINLVSARTVGDVVDSFVSSVGLTGSDATMDTAVERLAGALDQLGEALLVVDNAEQVVDAISPLLSTWLERAPRLTALVTSRERLRIRGEHVITLDALGVQDAVDLFVERARAQGVQITAEEQQGVVRRLVEELDRMPLAIELAASRSGMMSMAELLAGLDDRLSVLVGWERDRDARQQSLRGALDWSWELLDQDEKLVFRRCAVMERSFEVDQVEAVTAGALSQPVDRVLQSLVDKSMLWSQRDGAGRRRLGMYVNLRAYAADRLDESGERDDTVRRHALAVVAAAETSAESFEWRGGVAAAAALSRQRDVLLSVLRQLPETDAELIVRAMLCTEWALRSTLSRDRALAIATQVAPAAKQVGNNLQARYQLALGRLYDLSDAEAALACFERGLSVVPLDDERTRLALICERAEILQELGRAEMSEAAWRSALQLARRPGADPAFLRMALLTAATCLAIRGAFGEIYGFVSEGLALAAEVGDARRLARFEQLLGISELVRGDADASIEHSERAIEIYDRLGMPDVAANPLGTVGNAWLSLECYDDALECYREARERHMNAGADYKAVLQGGNLGWVHMELGDLDAAHEAFDTTMRRLDELGKPRNAAIARGNRSVLLHHRGDVPASIDGLREAARVLDEVGDRHAARFFTIYLARSLADVRQMDEAESLIRQVRREVEGAADTSALELCLVVDAHLALARGDDVAARKHIAAVRAAVEEGSSDITADLRFALKTLEKRG